MLYSPVCDYGCGQTANFQFKNRNWCCSESSNSCIKIKELVCKSRTGRKKCCSEETKQKMRKPRSEETKQKMRKPKSEDHKRNMRKPKSENHKRNLSKSLKGRIPWNKGKTGCFSKETLKKIGEGSKKSKHSEEFKENRRLYMKNGGSQYTRKFIKRHSKSELKLRDIVRELYPNCEAPYDILNYEVDIALPEYMIAIEWDGYYHFDTKEHKDYHKYRQEKIEQEGWKFVRYPYFQKFPSIDQIKKDVETKKCDRYKKGETKNIPVTND